MMVLGCGKQVLGVRAAKTTIERVREFGVLIFLFDFTLEPRPVRALGADAPSSRGAPGGLAVPARGAGPHAPSPFIARRRRTLDVRGRPGALPRDG